MGRASLETFSGEAQLKKHPVIMYNMISTIMHLTITWDVGVGFHAGTRSNIRYALARFKLWFSKDIFLE